jgi:hypothetical protein
MYVWFSSSDVWEKSYQTLSADIFPIQPYVQHISCTSDTSNKEQLLSDWSHRVDTKGGASVLARITL